MSDNGFRRISTCEEIHSGEDKERRSGQRWAVGTILVVFLALLTIATAWGIGQTTLTSEHSIKIQTTEKTLEKLVPTMERMNTVLTQIETRLEEE